MATGDPAGVDVVLGKLTGTTDLAAQRDATLRMHQVQFERANRLEAALAEIRDLCNDPGGPDSWSHTFQGRASLFTDDVMAVVKKAIG